MGRAPEAVEAIGFGIGVEPERLGPADPGRGELCDDDAFQIELPMASAAIGIFEYAVLHYNIDFRPRGTLGHYMTFSGLLMLVIGCALARIIFDLDDGPADPAAETAWDAEIRTRLKAYDEGQIETIPYETFRNEMERRFGR